MGDHTPPSWLSADEIEAKMAAFERAPDKWYGQMVAEWCPHPVERNGHLLPCRMAKGHDGPCVPHDHALRRHLLARSCVQWRCPSA